MRKTKSSLEKAVEKNGSKIDGFKRASIKKQLVKTLTASKESIDVKEYSINDAIQALRLWRNSEFKDIDLGGLNTAKSKKLLAKYKELYKDGSFDYQSEEFIPLDNKLAILLILENGGTAISRYMLGGDITEGDFQYWVPNFADKWNNGFFNIGLKESGKIKAKYEVHGDAVKVIMERI